MDLDNLLVNTFEDKLDSCKSSDHLALCYQVPSVHSLAFESVLDMVVYSVAKRFMLTRFMTFLCKFVGMLLGLLSVVQFSFECSKTEPVNVKDWEV